VREDNLVDYRNPGMALPVADALTAVLRGSARVVAASGGSGSGGVRRAPSRAERRAGETTRGAATVISRGGRYKRESERCR
jgi:hypothetical protein